jgi:murein DD-endopeptidase MepM/ murein hydrolase activator NlpD
MKKSTLFVVILLAAAPFARAQQTSPSGTGSYYAPPMNIAPLLSGSFGEFRPGHFHSGVDFKTEGREGVPVHAVADGSVVRIAYSASGFGRVIYMNHPNGTTSVYAHLQRFTPEMEAWFDEQRYAQQKDQVDTQPPAGKFRFRKGELIGHSGNSGGSGGPHLHFEIRETPSQRTLNVLSTGMVRVKDDIRPTIGRLFYIRVDTVMGVPVSGEPVEIALSSTRPGYYVPAAGEVTVADNGYFAIEAIDHANDTHNTRGIFHASMSVDSMQAIDIKRDKFLFSDTRYVNAMAHYPLNRASRIEVIRLAVMAGNRLPMYHGVKGRGALNLRDSGSHNIDILLEDEHGNRSYVAFVARALPFPQQALHTPMPPAQIARHDRAFTHAYAESGISIPAGSLYEPVFYTCKADTAAIKWRAFSSVQHFHNENTPLHSYVNIWVAANVPADKRGRACLARISADGNISCVSGTWEAANASLPERVTARVRDFGRYFVTADTIAPRIVPGFKTGADISSAESLKFTVTDDFSGVRGYRLTIDGRWALAEWDPKTRTLTHPIDRRRFPAGEHAIALSITDYAGNPASWRGKFIN